jgi:hypothetical protein
MKKIYSFAMAIALAFSLNAQTPVFSDNFDVYTAGSGVVASNSSWSFWSATPSDATVSNLYASSLANSAEINGQAVDLVLPMGPYTTGKYVTSFNMLIPTGSTGAYFNGLHTWSASSTAYEWGMDMFFDGAGASSVVIGSATTASPISNPIDQWFAMKIIIDLDVDSIWVKMDNNLIAASKWSLNNADGTQGLNQLSGFDFFGTDMAQGQGLYYIDDVEVSNYTGVEVSENNASLLKLSVFPNPTSESIRLFVPTGASVQVLDNNGRLVFNQSNITSGLEINTQDWTIGMYFVHMNHGGLNITEKLIIE